ncbi:MAG: class I SAM-dependent methyltransferase [Planctomycetes bacterium]|nr:class I SAM-dependent methyltransferase [Planctomycetota bacterium]
MSRDDDVGHEAERLKNEWEDRARSEARDFFVASHEGWDDERRWAAQATQDVAFITTGLSPGFLAEADVLALGCGVGRLVPELLARTRSYTGLDVAPSMVAEARRRLAGEPRARFFESDGLGVPAGACDRHYALVISVAVLIHCPRDVARALVHAGWERLAPGGVLRFQLLGLPADDEQPSRVPSDREASGPGPIVATPTATTPATESHADPPAGDATAPPRSGAPVDDADRSRADPSRPVGPDDVAAPDPSLAGERYMGHWFTEQEARDLLAGLDARDVLVVHVPPCHIYVSATRG